MLTQTTQVLTLAFDVVDAIQAAKANDGKIDLFDFPLLFPLIASSQAGIKDIELVPTEWKNSTADERAEVITMFKTRFDIADDVLEAKIEKLLEALVTISDVLLKLK